MEMFFERFSDPDFLWLIAAIAGCGVLGFAVQLTHAGVDILLFRRSVRFCLILAVGVIFLVSYQPAPDFDSQSLLPEEGGTDWFAVLVNILAIYFGSLALIGGAEKRFPNIMVFFDPSFYSVVKKSAKKKKS
jgi:hypothetical protein